MHPSREAIDTSAVRAQNSELLLELIWRERQISRADISRVTGLSPSTVSTIVSELEAAGLVRTLGSGASRGGRRPTLLGFCDDAFLILGVEIGARHVATTVIDLRGNVHAFEETLHPVRTDPKGTLERARELSNQCLRSVRTPRRKVVGVGVAVPSPIDPAAPGMLSELIFKAWRGIDVVDFFRRAHGLPVYLDNDANMGALAERWWGAGLGAREMAYVKVGAGVGAGLVIGGELYRGAAGMAGEIGHIPIDPQGPLCICGNHGCVTKYVGSEELSALARARFGKGEGAHVADIVRRAREGDREALRIVDEVGENLGVVVASLMHLLNPALIVLGGEITSVGQLVLDPLRAVVKKRVLPTVFAKTSIVTSNLGPRAIAIGAATLVLQAALRDRSLFAKALLGQSA